MRKSTKLITVAAALGFVAIGAGSAFTASNSVADSIAGIGSGTVTGAVITAVHYVQSPTDASTLDSVSFTSTTDLTNATFGSTVTMTLKDGAAAVMGISPYSCTYTAYALGATTITCLTADHPSILALAATFLTVTNT